MKILFVCSLFVLMGLSTGCASLVGIASEEGLKRMSPEKRVTYRETLDKADEVIHEAKSQYDSRYDGEGEPLPVTPIPTEEPVE